MKQYLPSIKNSVYFYIFTIIVSILIFSLDNNQDRSINLNNIYIGIIFGIVIGGILFLNKIGVRFYIIDDELIYTPTIFAVWFPRFRKSISISDLKEITYTGTGRYSPGRIVISPRPYEIIFPFASFNNSVITKFLEDLKAINQKITFDEKVTEIMNRK